MNEYDHLIQLQLAAERRSRRYTFGILLAWLLVVVVLIFGSGCADSHLWEEIEPIIEDNLVFEVVPVTVYDLPRQVGT